MTEAAAIFRAEAEARFGWVRRDRGEALYIAREPRGARVGIRLLDCREDGGVFLLTPSEAGAARLSRLLPPCPDQGMESFRGGAFAPEDLSLLARGCKIAEAPAPGEAARFMTAVHRRAAVLLREKRRGEGGALYICAQLAHVLADI